MLNRLFVLLAGMAAALVPAAASAAVSLRVQAVVPAAPAAAPASLSASGSTPVCGLEGEIGEGRGRIEARGANVGYRGEMTIPLAMAPVVVLKVVSEFAPHKPAIDRISLDIGAADSTEADRSLTTRLGGGFGTHAGATFTLVRGRDTPGQQTDWYEALMSGQTLTATEGEASAPVTYTADQFEADYNYLLDLLQLTAGWEVAGLCLNRAP